MPKKNPNRRINRIREILQSQSVQTGRTIVDLLSRTLTNYEVARLVELKLTRTADIVHVKVKNEVKDEPRDEVEEDRENRVLNISYLSERRCMYLHLLDLFILISGMSGKS